MFRGEHSHTCQRAREWISLELDAELSHFERALLSSHLDGCASCTEFRAGVGSFTLALRTAELESGEQQIALPSRRRRLAAPVYTAAAALAVIGVGLGSLVSAVGISRGDQFTSRPVAVDMRADAEALRKRQFRELEVRVGVVQAASRPFQRPARVNTSLVQP